MRNKNEEVHEGKNLIKDCKIARLTPSLKHQKSFCYGFKTSLINYGNIFSVSHEAITVASVRKTERSDFSVRLPKSPPKRSLPSETEERIEDGKVGCRRNNEKARFVENRTTVKKSRLFSPEAITPASVQKTKRSDFSVRLPKSPPKRSLPSETEGRIEDGKEGCRRDNEKARFVGNRANNQLALIFENSIQPIILTFTVTPNQFYAFWGFFFLQVFPQSGIDELSKYFCLKCSNPVT